jgi:Zn-dependent protease
MDRGERAAENASVAETGALSPVSGLLSTTPMLSSLFDPIYILVLLVALTLHEFAHAWVATRFGDPTPHNEGRLTLNPIAHLDPIGTFMILFGPFGWAKPVPVNTRYFSDPRLGIRLTALAGPAMNLVIAVVSYALLRFLTGDAGSSFWSLLTFRGAGSPAMIFALRFLSISVAANLSLMAFNLIPVVPLDGSKILASFLPPSLEDRYDDLMRHGPIILIALIVIENYGILPIAPLSWWVGFVGGGVLRVLTMLFGAIG